MGRAVFLATLVGCLVGLALSMHIAWADAPAQPVIRDDCVSTVVAGPLAWCDPLEEWPPAVTQPPIPAARGYAGIPNPAAGRFLVGTEDDPLAAFAHRPMDKFIIPEGGLYLDPLHEGPHYGIDYANPDDYLNGRETYFRPIGPGYVTTRSTCYMCFVDGDAQGRVPYKWPRYNFGWGGVVLVETPLSSDVSIYVLYAHLARDFTSLGDYVTPDDVLGVVGTTGYSQEFHLHVEVRFGPPGRFWNADFSDWVTLDRWMATMFTNPAHLILPELHPAFLVTLEEWLALQPKPATIP